jgi:very-short-patch-repair endonuclease
MSAAALWKLLRPEPGPIEVSLPSQSGRRRRKGLRIHRCPSLATSGPGAAEARTTARSRIPVTTPARTIHDLRATASPQLVRRAIRQAELSGFSLDRDVETDRTRSDLERDFLSFCRRHGIAEPEVNVRLGRWTVDFLWRAERLAVETDCFGYHRGSVAFEDDHARDLDLRRRGYDVRRFTGAQLRENPAEVAADLRDTLAPAS